jgi:hypothetical protein
MISGGGWDWECGGEGGKRRRRLWLLLRRRVKEKFAGGNKSIHCSASTVSFTPCLSSSSSSS